MAVDRDVTAYLDNYWRLLEARFHTGRISVADLIDRIEDYTGGREEFGRLTPEEADAVGAARRTFYIRLLERLKLLQADRPSDRERVLEQEVLRRLGVFKVPGSVPPKSYDKLLIPNPETSPLFEGPTQELPPSLPSNDQPPADDPIEPSSDQSEEDPEYRRIGVFSYLRSMWTLFWACILHPFTPTAIDLSTGRAIPPEEAHASASSDDLD